VIGISYELPVEAEEYCKLSSRVLKKMLGGANYWAGYYETMSSNKYHEEESYRQIARKNLKRMNKIAGHSVACLVARGHYDVEVKFRAQMARLAGKEHYLSVV